MSSFNFWWLKVLGAEKLKKASYILARIDKHFQKHPLPRPIQAGVPFTANRRRVFFLRVHDGLYVVGYDNKGQRTGTWRINEFLRQYAPATASLYAKRALENFHELLATYVFNPP